MKRGGKIGNGLAIAAISLASAGTLAHAQVFERDRTITGPRGNSVTRDVRIQRGPGFVDRDITIKRPGGTITRDTRIATGGFGPGPFFRGPGFGPRGVIVENFYGGPPVVGPLFGLGFGLPALNIGINAGGGGVVAPPPGGIPGPPLPPPPPADPVGAALARLSSFHGNSRRDACLQLGQLGDVRALPALTEKLEKDFDKDVRQAAAWALGEIGDPRSQLALQKASMYDHKHEVRDVAAIAIKKLGREKTPPPGQGAIISHAPASPPPMSPPPMSSSPLPSSNSLPEPRFDPPAQTGSGTPPPPPMPDPLGDLPSANPRR